MYPDLFRPGFVSLFATLFVACHYLVGEVWKNLPRPNVAKIGQGGKRAEPYRPNTADTRRGFLPKYNDFGWLLNYSTTKFAELTWKMSEIVVVFVVTRTTINMFGIVALSVSAELPLMLQNS
jgi:hypothetical protein